MSNTIYFMCVFKKSCYSQFPYVFSNEKLIISYKKSIEFKDS